MDTLLFEQAGVLNYTLMCGLLSDECVAMGTEWTPDIRLAVYIEHGLKTFDSNIRRRARHLFALVTKAIEIRRAACPPPFQYEPADAEKYRRSWSALILISETLENKNILLIRWVRKHLTICGLKGSIHICFGSWVTSVVLLKDPSFPS